MKLDFKLAEAYRGTRIELDGVIRALGGKYHGPKTVVTYQDGSIVKYKIEGELGQNSIPNKANAVKVEIGTLVTSIGNNAFQICSKLTSVIIPGSATSIGDSAFEGCSSLMSVVIGNGVTSIGQRAFQNCSKLTEVTIPDSVTNIEWAAFYNCSGLMTVTIGTGMIYIDNEAFSNCNNSLYNTTTIPGVTLVDGWAIGSEPTLSGELDLTNTSLRGIGYKAFLGCTGLTSVTIPDGVKSIGHAAFLGCTGLTSVTIPDSVIDIRSQGFENCSSLTSITIPSGVTSIGYGSFVMCTKLMSITSLRLTAPTVVYGSFGSSTLASSRYTGYDSRSSGKNVLKVPNGATGYTSSYWNDPLQNALKCGFHIEYI